jgi:hypothetical protein
MPADGIWRTLERLAKIIGVVVALVALGLVGYFASLGIQLVRQGSRSFEMAQRLFPGESQGVDR